MTALFERGALVRVQRQDGSWFYGFVEQTGRRVVLRSRIGKRMRLTGRKAARLQTAGKLEAQP